MQGRSQGGPPGGPRPLPIECCFTLLKTNNEKVSDILAKFYLRYV